MLSQHPEPQKPSPSARHVLHRLRHKPAGQSSFEEEVLASRVPPRGREHQHQHQQRSEGERAVSPMGEKTLKRRRRAVGGYEPCGPSASGLGAPHLGARKTTVGRGHWTDEENRILTELCEKWGDGPKNWNEIARHIEGRSPKQCRERWSFNLDPRVKHGPWSKEEDQKLLELQGRFGNQWSRIARIISGRSENAVKTRFKSLRRAQFKVWSPEEDALLAQATDAATFDCDHFHALMPHHTKHAIRRRFDILRVKRLAIEVGIQPCMKPGQNLFEESSPTAVMAATPSADQLPDTPAALPLKVLPGPGFSEIVGQIWTPPGSPVYHGKKLVRRSTSMRIMQEFITPDIDQKRRSWGDKSAYELLQRFDEIVAINRPLSSAAV